MKLTIGERIRVNGLLPKEANFVTLKIIRDLESELSFSEEETKSNNIRTVKEQNRLFTKWDNPDYENEIKFGDKATEIVVKALNKLEEDEKLTMADISLYEKFVVL